MDKRRSEEIAANRLKLITPLLDSTLDKEKFNQLKGELCLQTGLSERTIRRYIQLYEEQGFEGLKPKNAGTGGHSIIPEEVIQEAIALRREVPKRSINDIIKILEEEGIKIHIMPSSELSRGRGGPRCMSMPLIRENL
jgi:putative transposase